MVVKLASALAGGFAIFAVGAATMVVARMNADPGKPGRITTSSPAAKSAVVVELFTSEGCSSCPSADAVLQKLQKEQPVANAEIIPLSEHVDYWNYIGWNDPFSAKSYSQRQEAYARSFRLQSIYTPQMVINGRAEFVGSDRDRAESEIARAASAPKAAIQLTAVDGGTAPSKLKIQVDKLPGISAGDSAEVVLAITENGLSSSVSRGENTGRKLTHTAVVRSLRNIGEASGRSFSAEVTVPIERGWKRADLNAVVFVQERRSRHILGAATVALGG